MNVDGMRVLGARYPLNRELTDFEHQHRLKQNECLDVPLYDDFTVVRMNGAYLETVDRYFAWRGFIFFVMAALLCATLPFFVGMTITSFIRIYNGVNASTNIYFTVYIWAIGAPCFLLAAWGALQESFTYTYFPIRFNRKTRKVYLFRPGRPGLPVLEAEWDKVFFTYGPCKVDVAPDTAWDIRGHILAEDSKTVIDTFALGMFRLESEGDEKLRGYWEMIRRYMEEGPKEAYDRITYCDSIYEHHETLKGSLTRMYRAASHSNITLGVLLSPLWVPFSLARWIAGFTCRTPQWPTHIDAACAIEPNDPFIKDASMNAPKDRF